MKKLVLLLSVTLLLGAKAFACQAAFNWEQIANTLTIHFNSTSTSEHDIVSYVWHFGDGQNGDGQNPNHTYAAAGTYTACLIITDNVGCVSDVCHQVTVAPVGSGCEAAFTWEQIPNTLQIHFNGSNSFSQHDIISWAWTFGDGGTASTMDPYHTYNQAGTYQVCLTITDNVGCVDDVCHEVTVNAVSGSCEANFEWEQFPGTLTMDFFSTSTSEHDIISYQWNFGDGSSGDGANPSHTYDEAGTYTVCLIITDNVGCVSDICHQVTVAPVGGNGCEAIFDWEQLPGTLTEHFHSQSTSDHDIISYAWNFGDGHTGDGQNPYHTYAQPGTYVVCLTITDNVGCTSTTCHEVVVNPITPGDCEAGFNWEQLPNTLTIHFNNTSTSDHDIISYQWNFGDGHTGDGQNPYHTYAEAGVYNVCLTITDNTGCTSTICHEITVEPVTPGDCQASFTWEQASNSLNVHFFSNSTSDHDIISYFWDFGDGHTGDGNDPHHVYDQPGTYTVCLTITDNTGCTSTVCHEVVVEPVTPGECHAGFNWEQIPGTLTINFNNTSTSEHDITSYQWNFGDGHTGDGQNPHHTYAQAGTYTVCLTITDNTGCTSTICHEVVVEPVTPGACQAIFDWEQLNNSYTEHFHSQSTSEHDIISYSWNFGDGHTGDGSNPYHTYDQPGTYVVCLTITDNSGCTSTVCHEVTVNPIQNSCDAEFTWEQTDSLTIHFNSTSTSNHDIISYQWTFGDGGTASTQDPYHTYDQAGVYNVCLIITDNAGCVSDVCHEIALQSPASSEANFEEELSGSNVFIFHNHSFGFSEHTVWLWEFGDGSTSHEFNPHHVYEHPGTYIVCLTMINLNTGFLDKFCVEIMFGIPIIGGSPGNEFTQFKVPHDNQDHNFTGQVIEFRYSNPVKDELYLHYNISSDAVVNMSLYDITGKRVINRDEVLESSGVHDVTLSTSSLVPGMYAFHLIIGDQRIVKTILITQ